MIWKNTSGNCGRSIIIPTFVCSCKNAVSTKSIQYNNTVALVMVTHDKYYSKNAFNCYLHNTFHIMSISYFTISTMNRNIGIRQFSFFDFLCNTSQHLSRYLHRTWPFLVFIIRMTYKSTLIYLFIGPFTFLHTSSFKYNIIKGIEKMK